MRMSMMNVGIMRVSMLQPLVPVRMSVRFSARVFRGVLVLMVNVVGMFVLMRHGLVDMEVLVTFSQMEPYSNCHQRTCRQESHAKPFLPDNYPSDGADERSN